MEQKNERQGSADKSCRVSLAHHWLVSRRGGENAFEQLCMMFPEAAISTLVHDRDVDLPFLDGRQVSSSLLRYIPKAHRIYKSLLPFFPAAVSRLKASECDLLLSSDAAVIKGLKLSKGVPHVCYCYSPPRYLWDMADVYSAQSSQMGYWKRKLFAATVPIVRNFDRRSSENVTEFIAISHFVADRIRRSYGRDSEVIYPPVSVEEFSVHEKREDFYLSVGQLVPYKRLDIAVDAFTRTGKKLIVIGTGTELESLKKRAGSNVQFLGSQPFSVLKDHYQRCKAFVFPGIEDFGITPLEAQAAGAPVLAYGEGGALETVIEGETGTFFRSQSVDCLATAIQEFDNHLGNFSPHRCRENAERFSPVIFRKNIADFLVRKFPQLKWNFN